MVWKAREYCDQGCPGPQYYEHMAQKWSSSPKPAALPAPRNETFPRENASYFMSAKQQTTKLK